MAIAWIKEIDSVFIHIPKCGGMSIREYIFKTTNVFYGQIPISLQNKFKFAFIRNPYDRIVSAWKMFATGTDRGLPSKAFSTSVDVSKFEDFLKIAIDDSIGYQPNTTFVEFIRHHTIPMTHQYWLLDSANFIGRMESYEEDLKKIFNRLSINIPIAHRNKSSHNHYSSYYTDETFELVSKFYEEDLKRFNYKFKKEN